MTEAEETLLKALATAIVFGPTRHGEMRPFALARLKEAFEVGAKSKEQPCPISPISPSS